MKHALALLLVASCGGGEGGELIEATVDVKSVQCEVSNPTTVISRGTIDVFVRDDGQLRSFTSSNSFPQDGGTTQITVFVCGDWQTTSNTCARQPGDPARETVTFETTTNVDFMLPASFDITVSAVVDSNVRGLLADDFGETSCR